MTKIIGFCGRCRSGKSELAKICERYGYKKLYFALPLKQLCADILDISIDELNNLKNNGIPIEITINEDICKILSEETEIPLELTVRLCKGKYIETVRDMLQFIGTDYIRKYNKDWHVNKIMEMMHQDTKYVFEDVRFQNEKEMIEKLGGDCWFITRTTLDNISNHESETSITWQQCLNKVIINNVSLEAMLFKWELFISDYDNSCKIRDKEFNKILENGIDDDIAYLSVLDVIMISKAFFTYTPKEFNKEDIEEIKMNEDKTVFIKYKDNSMEIIENELNIEDLKIYVKES